MNSKLLTAIFILSIGLCGLLLFPGAKQAIATTGWKLYVSETELFSAILPGKPDESVTTFRIGNGLLLQSSEALSFIDQRPYKDVIKNYVINFDQTFGPAIQGENRVKIIEREMDLYEKSYRDRNAKVVDRNIENFAEYSIGRLSLTYDDFEENLQAVSAKILVTKTSKFHQLFSGPAKDLELDATDKYFKSFNSESGVISRPGTMNEEWRRIVSPFSLFAIKIPPVTPPYFNNEPTVTRKERTERIGMVFTDPIWAQNLFYSVTGYQLDKEMSFELAKEVLLERHLKRHGRNEVGIDFTKDFIGETPYIEAHYVINPPKAYPYLNQVRIRAFFLGNYMAVQEVVGPRHLVVTDFAEGVFNLIEFTPKKAFQKELQRHLNAATAASKPAQ